VTTFSRRRFLAASAASAGAVLTTPLGARVAFASPDNPAEGDSIVVIDLRGGADGLSIAPPYTDNSYYSARPTTAVRRPGEEGGALPLTSASSPNAIFPTGMDGVLGLHPTLWPIYETLWKNGNLAVIPAVGAGFIGTRSHFSAEWLIERGTANSSVPGSFMGRMINEMNPTGAVGGLNARSNFIFGAQNLVTVNSLSRFKIQGYTNEQKPKVESVLAKMYSGNDSLSATGVKALEAFEAVGRVKVPKATNPRTNKGFKNTGMTSGLMEVAGMLNAKVGLRAAAVDFHGWDHHVKLNNIGGRIGELGLALRAFADATNQMEEVTVIVLTEFGRNVAQNGGGGTDHGKGATHLVMGKGIQGGVFGNDFPTNIVKEAHRRAVPVLTDYRQIINEIAVKRAGIADPGKVFPGFGNTEHLGLARA